MNNRDGNLLMAGGSAQKTVTVANKPFLTLKLGVICCIIKMKNTV